MGLCSILAVPAQGQSAPGTGRVYVVQSGDTLSTIAAHLGVATRALAERNHLAPPFALRTGRRLRLPDGVDAAVARALPTREQLEAGTGAAVQRGARTVAPRGREYGRPRRPGLVQMIRESNDETMALQLRRVTRGVLRRMEHFLRYSDAQHHPIEPRLLRQLALVSDHFGGRRLHVISGFRPVRHGQWTAHSNHNIGHAVDFRVEGVSNRAVRDFCRTLPRTGCGYYPRSVFVHMDVRDESTTWVDWSRPGQRPIYGREDRPPPETPAASTTVAAAGAADESVEDVAAESAHVRTAPEPPAETTPAAGTESAITH